MSGHEAVIFLSIAITVAALAAGLFLTTGETQMQGLTPDDPGADVRIIEATAFNISNASAKYVRVAITTDSGALRLNQTLITIRTEEAVADLQYRPGVLERNAATGFYTE